MRTKSGFALVEILTDVREMSVHAAFTCCASSSVERATTTDNGKAMQSSQPAVCGPTTPAMSDQPQSSFVVQIKLLSWVLSKVVVELERSVEGSWVKACIFNSYCTGCANKKTIPYDWSGGVFASSIKRVQLYVNACNWIAAVCAAAPLALVNQLPLPRL